MRDFLTPLAEPNVAQDTDEQVVIGLDYGVKKMGVAIGNTIAKSAQAASIITMDNGYPDWQQLLLLIKTWRAKQVIVGLPLHLDGSQSHMSLRATKFAKRLNHRLKAARYGCQVILVDERLTSIDAKTTRFNRPQKASSLPIDDDAAAILLASYLHEPQGRILE